MTQMPPDIVFCTFECTAGGLDDGPVLPYNMFLYTYGDRSLSESPLNDGPGASVHYDLNTYGDRSLSGDLFFFFEKNI